MLPNNKTITIIKLLPQRISVYVAENGTTILSR